MLWFRPPPEGAEQGDRESSTGILENLPRNKKRAGGGVAEEGAAPKAASLRPHLTETTRDLRHLF